MGYINKLKLDVYNVEVYRCYSSFNLLVLPKVCKYMHFFFLIRIQFINICVIQCLQFNLYFLITIYKYI
jgi:hypothetical protein